MRFRPGETIYLALYWRAREPVSRDYAAFLHPISQEQRLYGGWDRQLGGDFRSSSTCSVGEVVMEEYPIVIDPETPADRYTIKVGLYLSETMQRLAVVEGPAPPGDDRALPTLIDVAPE